MLRIQQYEWIADFIGYRNSLGLRQYEMDNMLKYMQDHELIVDDVIDLNALNDNNNNNNNKRKQSEVGLVGSSRPHKKQRIE